MVRNIIYKVKLNENRHVKVTDKLNKKIIKNSTYVSNN